MTLVVSSPSTAKVIDFGRDTTPSQGKLNSTDLIAKLHQIFEKLPERSREFYLDYYPKHGHIRREKETYYDKVGVLQSTGTACESSKMVQMLLLFEGQVSNFVNIRPLSRDWGSPVKGHGYLTMTTADGVEMAFDPTYKALLRGIFHSYRSEPNFEKAMSELPDFLLADRSRMGQEALQMVHTLTGKLGVEGDIFVNPPILHWMNYEMIYKDEPEKWNGIQMTNREVAGLLTHIWTNGSIFNPWQSFVDINKETIGNNKDPDIALVKFLSDKKLIEVAF